MALPFAEYGRQRLATFVDRRLLCAFDFDGTLAPIVTDPAAARMPEDTRDLLITLRLYAPVAILTGRSVGDVQARLGFEPDFIVGNHGLEGVPGHDAVSEQYVRMAMNWEQVLRRAIERRPAYADGVEVEPKRYSLSVHYRQARDPILAALWLKSIFKQLTPTPHIIGGKYVFNLLPQHAGDKGTALEQLIHASGARAAVFVGDDVTDEDAFRLQRSNLLGVKIGDITDTNAEYFLPSQQDINLLLHELIVELRDQGAHNWLRSL